MSKTSGSRLVVISGCSHLSGRDDLQRSQGNLEVGSVGLEVVESLSDARLELRGVLPRRAVGSDLVQGLGAHLDYVLNVLLVEGRDGGCQWIFWRLKKFR